MKTTITQARTITARNCEIAASRFSGDWRHTKYQRKRIKAYGEINRNALKELGATITTVKR